MRLGEPPRVEEPESDPTKPEADLTRHRNAPRTSPKQHHCQCAWQGRSNFRSRSTARVPRSGPRTAGAAAVKGSNGTGVDSTGHRPFTAHHANNATEPRAPGQADGGTRTPDPFITSEVLYQLSYVGVAASTVARRRAWGPVRPGDASTPSYRSMPERFARTVVHPVTRGRAREAGPHTVIVRVSVTGAVPEPGSNATRTVSRWRPGEKMRESSVARRCSSAIVRLLRRRPSTLTVARLIRVPLN
jgi:hypothetical protein